MNFAFRNSLFFLFLLCCCKPTTEQLAVINLQSQQLINGNSVPNIALSYGQRATIGSLGYADVRNCTAVMIDERRIITAAHCLDGVSRLFLRDFHLVMPDMTVAVPVDSFSIHPHFDFAVAILGAQPEAGIDFEYLQLNQNFLTEDLVGTNIAIAGAGVGTDSALGITFGEFEITEISEDLIRVNGIDEAAACRGDSGGPYLQQHDFDQLQVIALESKGDIQCGGKSSGVRLDVVADWIQEMNSTPLPQKNSSCELQSEGNTECAGEGERKCFAGWWRERDC